jgi:hypothetical protein
MYESCAKKDIPIGVAPNIEVSLIVQPDDGRFLAERNLQFYYREAKRGFQKFLANRLIFKNELKPRKIEADVKDFQKYRTNWKDTTQYTTLVLPRTGQTISRNV